MEKSYIFIAFGMGITPFRSMIQDLVDKKKRREIVLFYQARNKDELLFTELFKKAEGVTGLRTFYCVDEKLDLASIKKVVSGYLLKTYFISGPQPAVEEFRDMLHDAGVSFEKIETDLFTGYDE